MDRTFFGATVLPMLGKVALGCTVVHQQHSLSSLLTRKGTFWDDPYMYSGAGEEDPLPTILFGFPGDFPVNVSTGFIMGNQNLRER